MEKDFLQASLYVGFVRSVQLNPASVAIIRNAKPCG